MDREQTNSSTMMEQRRRRTISKAGRPLAMNKMAAAAALLAVSGRSAGAAAGATAAANGPADGEDLVQPSRQLRRLRMAVPAPRIVGGTEVVDPNKWPSIAAIFEGGYGGPSFMCGGILIAPRVLLTAGHCTQQGANPDRALVGGLDRRPGQSPDATQVTLSKRNLRVHPGYRTIKREGVDENDLAVYKLDEPISGPYARVNPDQNVPSEGTKLEAAGWGSTKDGRGNSPKILREVSLNYVTQTRCVNVFGSRALRDDMLCAMDTGRDACSGDSGGPLMEGDTLVGITSWGEKCGGGSPGVYSRVSYNYQWIREQVCDISRGDEAPAEFRCDQVNVGGENLPGEETDPSGGRPSGGELPKDDGKDDGKDSGVVGDFEFELPNGGTDFDFEDDNFGDYDFSMGMSWDYMSWDYMSYNSMAYDDDFDWENFDFDDFDFSFSFNFSMSFPSFSFGFRRLEEAEARSQKRRKARARRLRG